MHPPGCDVSGAHRVHPPISAASAGGQRRRVLRVGLDSSIAEEGPVRRPRPRIAAFSIGGFLTSFEIESNLDSDARKRERERERETGSGFSMRNG